MDNFVKRIYTTIADVAFFAGNHAGDVSDFTRAKIAPGYVVEVFHDQSL
jgi:hypothetical protein